MRRLQLRGFKTFVQPTDLEFDAGVTAIVGPNGSGKSNLVDALRWVLGEQSLRLLRSRKTEDVIFAGSSQRSRLGMAEVSLTLDNETGWIDLPYPEVTITRRAHRSGENECLLNSARVRLRDVNSLLDRAHAGQTGYTVIGQGMVDAVLSWRPEDRRTLIDETAQLRLPQAQLEEARQKLAGAQDDLQRLEAKLTELQPRLEQAAQRAAQAQEHARLTAELLTLQRRHYGDLWQAATSALEEALAGRQQAAGHLTSLEKQVEQVQSQIGRARARQTELQSRLAGLRTRRAELERSRERWRRQMAVAGERQEMLSRQRQQLAAETEALSARLSQAQSQVAEAEVRLREIRRERQEAERLLKQAEAGRQGSAEAERQKQADLQALRHRLGGLSRQLTEQREHRLRLEHRRDTLAAGLAGRRRSLAEAETRLASQVSRIDRLRERRQEQEQAVQAAQQRLAGDEQALASGQAEMEASRREREQLSVELAHLRAQWEQTTQRSESLLEALRPADNRPPAAQAGARGADPSAGPRILGTVEQLMAAGQLRVQPTMERAVAAALQGFRFNLVVKDWEEARQALTLVSQRPVGEVWVLPRDVPEAGPAPVLPDEAYLGPASDWAKPRGPSAALVQAILSHSLVVVDLEAALRLLPQCPPQYQMVTVAGEVVQPWGRASAIPGGQPPLPTEEVRARLEVLPALITETDARTGALQKITTAGQGRVRQDQGKLHEAQTALRLTEADLANAETARRRAEAELPRTRQSIARDEKELERVTEQKMAAAEDIATLGPQLQAAEENIKAQEEELRTLAAERVAASSELRHQHELWEKDERTQGALLEDQRRRAADLNRETSQRQARAQALEQEAGGTAAEIETATAQAQTISEDLKQLVAEVDEAEHLLKTESGALEALQAQERAGYRTQAQAEAALREATVVEERVRKEAAALERQIRAEVGSLEDLEPGVVDEALPGRLRQVQDELRRLGPPDEGAITEHAALQAEEARLCTNLADLQECGQELTSLVTRLEGALNERFQATFQAVQAEFQRFFRAIFGGGHGHLELIASEEGTAIGLEIVAQPPGKRLQSLASLSGGERALTSIAFFFAMLRVQPPPFCVLDEVDAALDDANAGRFAELLGQLASRTQFLVITHNRVTMESAGTLYGVTMGETGSSQVVSLRLAEAQSHSTPTPSTQRREVTADV